MKSHFNYKLKLIKIEILSVYWLYLIKSNWD